MNILTRTLWASSTNGWKILTHYPDNLVNNINNTITIGIIYPGVICDKSGNYIEIEIKKDKIKLSKLLSHLKESLDYSPQTEKLSYLFASVYDHISFLIRNDKFDEAKSSFNDIKATWKQAHNLR